MKNAKASAFPLPIPPTGQKPKEGDEGLTKREYFAICAMQGMLSQSFSWTQLPDKCASIAIDCADSLLKRLAEK